MSLDEKIPNGHFTFAQARENEKEITENKTACED